MLFVSFLSLLLKLLFLIQGEVVNSDAGTYVAAADWHSQGLFQEGLRHYRMPLYPLLLAGTHIVVPDWILAGRFVSISSLLLCLFPLYGITKRLFCRSAALWAACLFAVLPVFNESAMDIKRDPLFLFFTLCGLWLLVVFAQENRFRFFSGFLAFATLATLTRIEGCLLFFIAPISLLLSLRNNTVGRRKKIVGGAISAAVVVASVLVASAAGVTKNLRINELSIWFDGLLSFKFFKSYQDLLQALKELQMTLPGARYSNNLLEVTRHYAPLVYCLGLLETLLKAIFPTSLLALWALRWRNSDEKKMTRERWLIMLIWVGFALLNLLFLFKRNFIQERYFWIPIVLTLPWVGYGINLWWQRRRKKIVSTFAVVLILLSPLAKSVAVAVEPEDKSLIKAAHWLRQYDQERKAKILYNDRRLPLYANRISEVVYVREYKTAEDLTSLRRAINKFDFAILYFSRKKIEGIDFQGFDVFKKFQGDEKVVFFLTINQ
ncbi:Dolichyl-phosphate-mannose-protein mannosyltransferase [Malonomonas rubra DSM 5091]|uniref:Dolichyl-phosphate-mannose-protein mannosyltransferase n=1 Tax=Malonomonas rubra DSM 5091 TaxID=1122189 RepID=A0A1M6C7H1_MALRU|nr:Dolichyl-phosphate-mannose-protein mannosyltransferase [Malonomonas rubra DSM 5091]